MPIIFTTLTRLLPFIAALFICAADVQAQKAKSTRQQSDYPVDTIYYPFQNGIQMIAILNFSCWERFIARKEAMHPRALHWSEVIPPRSPNMYLFRDKSGKILKSYHISNPESLKLRSTAYMTPSPHGLFSWLAVICFSCA